MKIKFRNKGVMMLSLLLMLATAASAGNVALRCGFTPSGYSASNNFTFVTGADGGTVYLSNGSTPVPASCAVECYWMSDLDRVFHDPGYGNVLIGSVKYVGSDSDTWNTFSGTAGKFYHDYSTGGTQFTSGNNFYFRVWDSTSPAGSGALFGESGTVTANYDDNVSPMPLNNGLTNLKVQFTQGVPADPVIGVNDITVFQAPSGGYPSISVGCHSVVHGRWYEFQVSNTSESSSFTATYPYKQDTATNSQHAADINTTTVKTGSIQLGRYDDGKYVKVRARACNDYGNSAWVESGALLIPVTQSSNRPAVVSDLQAVSGTNSITLTWTAPYLLDAHNQRMAATSYDIRIATAPIVDTWEAGNTNPTNVTNWAAATPITAAPYNFDLSHFSIATYQAPQTLTVSNVPMGQTYYLALKSFNGAVGSYISNVTGAGFGGGGSQSWTLTIESQVSANPPGHGINHFSLPFPGPWYAYKADGTTALGQIQTAYDLVTAVNLAAGPGSKIVSTFTKWVGASSTPNETGVIITNNDPDATGVQAALQAIPLSNGTAFELYATQAVKLVIKNY
jgi:hypothetical protein